MLLHIHYILTTSETKYIWYKNTSETKYFTWYKDIHDFTNDIVYNITYDITTYEHKKIKTNVSSHRLRSDGGKSCFCKRWR